MEELKHEIVSDLKRVASELGRIPTRDEYTDQGNYSRYKVTQAFGSYSVLVQVCGFKPEKKTKKVPKGKVLSNLYTALKHKKHGLITEYQQEIYNPARPTCVPFGDLHCPFWCERTVKLGLELVEYLQPEWVLQVGDARDQYSYGRFPRSYNVMTPKEEDEEATKQITWFWKEIKRRAPNSKRIMLLGNHDYRGAKRVIESYPEMEHHYEDVQKKLYTFNDCETIFDTKEPFMVGDVGYIHGHLSKSLQHAEHFRMNIVHGHTHRLEVNYKVIDSVHRFAMSVGYMADPSSVPLSYPMVKETRWCQAVGYINQFGPNPIPLGGM